MALLRRFGKLALLIWFGMFDPLVLVLGFLLGWLGLRRLDREEGRRVRVLASPSSELGSTGLINEPWVAHNTAVQTSELVTRVPQPGISIRDGRVVTAGSDRRASVRQHVQHDERDQRNP